MIELWWITPVLAGLLLALAAGSLGCFVVWRRMAFFGDTLAHGALLGVTFGVITEVNPTIALMIGSIILALLLLPLQNLSKLSPDTLLGIVSHGTLAIGLVLLSISSDVRVDLMGYLFGDLLAIGYEHIILLLITTCFTLGFMYFYWDALLAVTISPELAKIEGRPVARINIALILLMAVTVALAMKVVGVLLISAMLIIPPATARALSQTPQQMLFFSCTVGVLAVTLGIAASFQWDTPTGPSIIVASLCLFLLSLLGKPCTSL